MAQFGFIGMGNIGYAMLNSVLGNLHQDRLYLRHRTKKNVKNQRTDRCKICREQCRMCK